MFLIYKMSFSQNDTSDSDILDNGLAHELVARVDKYIHMHVNGYANVIKYVNIRKVHWLGEHHVFAIKDTTY